MPVVGGWLGLEPAEEFPDGPGGDPVIVDPEGDLPPTIDHVAAGLARLREQYRRPNIIALTKIFLQRYADVEAAFYALLIESIYNAVGVRLDMYGRIVGQSRNSLDDDTYRRFIFARIATNRSFATTEDLILLCRLVINDEAIRIRVETIGPAYVRVALEDGAVSDATADILITYLRRARGLAIRLVLETAEDVPAEMFTCRMCCFLNGTHSIGTNVVTPTGGVTDVMAFPPTGFLTLDHGGGSPETHAYVRSGSNFLLPASVTVGAFSAGTIVVLTDSGGTDLSLGKGWGDESNPATGGKLARAIV